MRVGAADEAERNFRPVPKLFSDTRASYDSRYFGSCLEKGSITIWRSDSTFPIATVKPGFSGGTERHAIDSVNRLIYSGTWEDGLTSYDYDEKKVVWHRSDLVGIQTVNISAGFPSSVFLTLATPDHRLDEDGMFSGIVELDAQTGSTRWTLEDGHWVYLHPRKPLIVVQDSCEKVVRILDNCKNEIGITPMANFAIIDVGFADDMIALAEGQKGVRIIDFSGRVISHYVPLAREPNCIRAEFDGDCVCVFDSWKGSFVSVIEPRTGRLITEYQRDTHGEICFIDDGSRFVDCVGRICKSRDGKVVAELDAN